MLPDRTFNLHKIPKSLRHTHGVYRLVHRDIDFHASTAPSGRRRWSNVLRIGHSSRLLGRLAEYAAATSEYPDFNDFLREHRGRIDVEVEYVPRGRLDDAEHRFALRTREALHIVAHATKKGRIPAFNLRGEFNTACRNADVCFTAAERAAFLLPWDGDVS